MPLYRWLPRVTFGTHQNELMCNVNRAGEYSENLQAASVLASNSCCFIVFLSCAFVFYVNSDEYGFCSLTLGSAMSQTQFFSCFQSISCLIRNIIKSNTFTPLFAIVLVCHFGLFSCLR